MVENHCAGQTLEGQLRLPYLLFVVDSALHPHSQLVNLDRLVLLLCHLLDVQHQRVILLFKMETRMLQVSNKAAAVKTLQAHVDTLVSFLHVTEELTLDSKHLVH